MCWNKSVPLGHISFNRTAKDIIEEIMRDGNVTEGKYVKRFEMAVRNFLGVKHAIATCNGTAALELIGHYLARKYGKGLTVCVPATTFPATLNAFYNCGHNIVLCDVYEDLTININTLTKAEKEEIDFIVPVSLLGYPPHMNEIRTEALHNHWIIVEDFAEAFGSSFEGERLGSLGDFGASSFYASHVIQAGELGVVTTNDDKAAKIMRSMKNHGRTGSNLEFLHGYVGSNYKTTEFCAGMAYSQLEDIDSILFARYDNARIINDGVKNTKLYKFPVTEDCGYLGLPFLAENEKYKRGMIEYLTKKDIEVRGMFPCLANQIAYRGMGFTEGSYPVSEDLEKRGFYVPCHQHLTIEQIRYLIKGLNEEL